MCLFTEYNNYEYYIFWMAHDNQLVIVYFVAKPNYEKEIPTKKKRKIESVSKNVLEREADRSVFVKLHYVTIDFFQWLSAMFNL